MADEKSPAPMLQLALNELIKLPLGVFNSKIQSEIRDDNLDPLVNVFSDSIDAYGVTASYSLRNLRGLSSAEIKEIVISELRASTDLKQFSGTLTMVAQLANPLTADIKGSVKAPFVTGADYTGDATWGEIKLTTSGHVEASKNEDGYICIDDIKLSAITPDIGPIVVHIDGLGDYSSDLLTPLEEAIKKELERLIPGLMSVQISKIISDAINSQLPMCTPIKSPF